MENQKKLLEKFEPEELEQRFEMGWKFKKANIITPSGSSQDGIK